MNQEVQPAKAGSKTIDAIRDRMTAKKWPEALRLIGKLDAAEVDPTVVLWKARAFYHAGELGKAKAEFEAILNRDGFNREAMITLARLAYREQDWAEVRALMTRLLSGAPNDADAHILMARVAANDRQDSIAISHYEAVRGQRPDDAEALKALGRLYLRTEVGDAAIAVLKRLLTLKPDDAEANLLLARAAFVQKDDEALTAALDRLAELEPGHVEAQVLRGRMLSRRKDDKAALKVWGKLKGEAPTAREACVQLARIHARREEWEAAHDAALEALKLDAAHEEMRRLRATAAGKLGRSDEARDIWTQILTARPDDVQAAVEAARATAAAGDPGAARDRLRLALAGRNDLGLQVEYTRLGLLSGEVSARKALAELQAVEPDVARLVTAMMDGGLSPLSQFGPALDELALAEAFANEGRWSLAQRVLETVPALARKAHRLTARVLTGLREHKQADKAWAEVLKLEPKDREALAQRTLIALRDGRPKDAVPLAEAWIEAEPESGEALIVRARALGRSGRHKEAFAAWTKARKHAPKSVEAWVGEASSAWTLEDRDAARKAAAGAAKLEAANLDAAIILARCAQAEGKGAAEAWERVATLAPDRLEAHLQVARLARKAEQTDAAIAAYQRVLAIDPAHLESLSHLGRMLRTERRREEEVKIWEAFIEHHPETVEPRLFLARCKAGERDIPGAIELYRSILKFEPRNERALDELSTLVAKAAG